MNIGALIIGDEILSGRRQDKHLPRLIEMLGQRGLRLAWVRICGDDRTRLVETLKQTFATGDLVFSFGGIGATPDDHTRQAAASALGLNLELNAAAEREIRANYGDETTEHRLRMGEFPVGSSIIPNPVNRIPGFSHGTHHFVPGFPQMAWPMVEWVLDTLYADLHHAEAYTEASIAVFGALEGHLVDLMRTLEVDFPGVSIFSLPTLAEPGKPRQIELGAKGDPGAVEAAMEAMCAEIARRGYEWKALSEAVPGHQT